jgi:hypothetical protein
MPIAEGGEMPIAEGGEMPIAEPAGNLGSRPEGGGRALPATALSKQARALMISQDSVRGCGLPEKAVEKPAREFRSSATIRRTRA